MSLRNPQLQLWREADGGLNLQRLFAPANASASGTTTVSTSSTAPPWRLALQRLSADGAVIALQDRSVTAAFQLRLAPVAFTVQHYSSEAAQPLSFELAAGVGDTGHLRSQGTVALTPLNAVVSVDLKDFDLPALQPYVWQQTQMTIYRGRIGAQAQLAYLESPAATQPTLKLSANIDLRDLATRDNLTNSDLISWRDLQLAAAEPPPSGASSRLMALLALYGAKFHTAPAYPSTGPNAGAAAAADTASATASSNDAAQTWLEQQLLPTFAPTQDQRDGLGRARADAVQNALLTNTQLQPERVFLTERNSTAEADGSVCMELKLQ